MIDGWQDAPVETQNAPIADLLDPQYACSAVVVTELMVIVAGKE